MTGQVSQWIQNEDAECTATREEIIMITELELLTLYFVGSIRFGLFQHKLETITKTDFLRPIDKASQKFD